MGPRLIALGCLFVCAVSASAQQATDPRLAIGAVLGGAVGGMIGYFRRSERWERIR